MAKALEGIKVLDFTRHFAGPFCTMILREFGAEVIKLEIPGSGDGCRQGYPQTEAMEGYHFINLNRGKKSITLNLQTEKGRQITLELVKKVDVVVENFTPDVMDRLGLGYKTLSQLNPDLIYAASCGYGHTGPRRDEPAFDPIIQAMSGIVAINGPPDSSPIRVSFALVDYLAGYNLAISILAALNYRSRTGEGQAIDISMQDCAWELMGIEIAPSYYLTGKNPQRIGNAFTGSAPTPVCPTKDGYIVISTGSNEQWDNFLRIIGRADLIGAPQYSDSNARAARRSEVDAFVYERTKTMTTEHLLREFKKARVPCSNIPEFYEVANDPHLLSREMVIEVEQPVSGKVKVPGSVYKLSKTPGDARQIAPFLGEHNYEIYSGWLGYSEAEITKLAEDGVI